MIALGTQSTNKAGRHRSTIDLTARTVLLASLRARRTQLWRLAAWSLLEALPALLSGILVALAVDEGFLAGRLGVGFGWLGLLAISVALGAWGTHETLSRLAAVVEPFRDDLVTGVV
ncbi:MAG: hypothetical protein H0U22_00500, partial [Geodermatophilaceae bacterium]|nr:hypothetical protein [Geodermatophilaceae bacterium]